MGSRAALALVAGLAWAGALSGQAPPPVPSAARRASLVVLVAVDQMRADYLARYASQWTGGFARIYRGGTVFEHGEQDHAATETAPGHATMLSGRYPAHTGIALNARGVQDPDSPVLGASDEIGASPRRFRGTTLYGWMLAATPGAAARQPNAFPWIDSLTLAFALEGVQALELGRRGRPDLLSVSLSTTDAIGHAFGPDSREIHDQLLHVDRWLGQFFDSLAQLVPAAGTVVVLTADHGVTPLPEYTVTRRHRPGGRVWLGGVARGASAALRTRFPDDFSLDFDSGLLVADQPTLRMRHID